MALLSDKTFNGTEFLDHLFEHADETSAPEDPKGGHVNLTWSFPDQSLLSHSEDEADHFLDSLLNVCECGSSSSTPLWAPSPCDSGISDDPLSEHLDSPPPPPPPPPPHPPPPSPLSSNLFLDSLNSQHHHLLPVSYSSLYPPPQSHQQQHSEWALSDVSINVDTWESNLSLYTSMVPQCVSNPDASSVFQLSVKDLLLSNLGESPKPPSQNVLQDLVLNEEEKKLLAREGVSLPNQLPLTKYEEKILKKIRRKIRNKQSAQESRKKKKEYLDGLEGRMAACSSQNVELQKKVIQLEKTNSSLMEQLRRLQALVMNSSNKPAQTGVCVLVLLLSFSLILFPRFQPLSHSRSGDSAEFSTAKVQSRSLRSVVEVHSQQPVFSRDRQIETATNIISKLHARPEYADMEPLHHNHSYSDQKHHRRDPITGYTDMVGWHSRVLSKTENDVIHQLTF